MPDLRKWSDHLWTWLSLGLTAVLLAAGGWYLVSQVSLAEIAQALAAASWGYVLLSLAVVVLVLLLKAWRWQLMFPARDPARQQPFFAAAFWALLLGAYLNTLIPFLRLGELARIVALDRQTGISKVQSLSTLMLEKVLDLIMVGLTVALIVTAVALPDALNQTHTTLVVSAAAVGILLGLYLIAAQTALVTRLLQALFSRLPEALGRRLTRWTVSGLDGLAALRDRRLAALLVGLSAFIAAAAVLTPVLLLRAFHIPLGWVEAVIIHVATLLALIPPTTPGKIGIFDGVVAFLLLQFGFTDGPVIASYTITYHLVVVGPLIVLGSLAAYRTKTPIRQEWLQRQD